jgi:hypothetical protein
MSITQKQLLIINFDIFYFYQTGSNGLQPAEHFDKLSASHDFSSPKELDFLKELM